MTDQELVSAYCNMNQSFQRTLVWHVGIDAGFFAEYTEMLHAMLFCLEHNLQFRLYSDDANFGCGKGWTDFFEPFCPEEHRSFHHKYNTYAGPSWKKVWASPERVRLCKWKLKSMARHAIGDVFALFFYGVHARLSQAVSFDNHRQFRIPELGIDGNYFQALSRMADITWHFNAEVSAAGRKLEKQLALGPNLVGCQIRGGDKATETALLPPEIYVDMIRRRAPGREVFVLTDDYRLFVRLKNLAPEIRWLTLCQPEETGYVNAAFTNSNIEAKRNKMVRFLTSMQILRRVPMFFGSVTPGPSLFVLKTRYPDVVAVDCPPAKLAETLMLPIAGRSRVATAYVDALRKG